jgi:hypothetical protein
METVKIWLLAATMNFLYGVFPHKAVNTNLEFESTAKGNLVDKLHKGYGLCL